METEIELKFFVSPSFLQQIQKSIEGAKVLQQSKRYFHNIYFDTQDFLLRNNDIGLRIRRFEDVYVQTLKTSGRVIAGLHQRPEYNAELSSETLNLDLIPEGAWPVDLKIKELDLQPIFSTDFERHQWLISMPDSSQIELAFDLGNVDVNGAKQDDICEVEIELKSGHVDALFLFARKLAEKGELRLGNLSKAAKGYRLATNYQGSPVRALCEVPVNKNDTAEQGFIKSIEHGLAHWHHHEQIYIENQNEDALLEIMHSLTLIRQALKLYNDLIPKRASVLIRQELQWLEIEFTWMRESLAIKKLCDDKGYFLRKLNAQKQLCSKLRDRSQSLPEPEQILSLFHSSRYCHLLLDLSRWLLTRGWQPFSDKQATQVLSSPLVDYANQALASSWELLFNDFSLLNKFDRFTYLEKQISLTRSLFSGFCLGALYDSQRKQSFRLPWLDLLQGIEDLEQLEPIRALLLDKEISTENKIQMEKWLERKEESLLNAMMQSRQIGLNFEPYWMN